MSKETIKNHLHKELAINFDKIGSGDENLILVVAFAIRKLNYYQIKERVINSSDESYLRKFFNSKRVQLMI